MKRHLISAITGFALLAAAAPALAADLITTPPMVEDSFSWEGAYVGGFISSYPFSGQLGAGVELGANFLPAESFLIGVSISGAAYATGFAPEGFLKGRAGFVADKVVVYGFGSVGNFVGGPGLYELGAGLEVAVTDNLSLDAEAGSVGFIGAAPAFPRLEAGVRFHF